MVRPLQDLLASVSATMFWNPSSAGPLAAALRGRRRLSGATTARDGERPGSHDRERRSDYRRVLGMSFVFFQAQRSGRLPHHYPLDWVQDSLTDDVVSGGYYDAGNTLKPAFPLASAASHIAWGLADFVDAYRRSGTYRTAYDTLRVATDYLMACNVDDEEYIGQIGVGTKDYGYWGRPSQYNQSPRPREYFKWSEGDPAADLLGAVSAGLAAASVAFRREDPRYSRKLLEHAIDLYKWAIKPSSQGFYNPMDPYNPEIGGYGSSAWNDDLMYAAAWLWRATGQKRYLDDAYTHWKVGGANVYPSYDSVYAQALALLIGAADANSGVARIMPGLSEYRDFFENQFLNAWLNAPLNTDGAWALSRTPCGLVWPSWSQYGVLRYGQAASMVMLFHARNNRNRSQRAAEVEFARRQAEYALGSCGRSYVVGWHPNGIPSPLQPHSMVASCPDLPAPCGVAQKTAPGPNPQELTGAVVGGPYGGDAGTYNDDREDFITNQPTIEYNAFFSTLIAGLSVMPQ